MKTVFFRIACVLVALTPLCSSAQSNITKAFDALLKNSDVTYTENHSLDKDVTTGVKESQYDIYTFTMPANKMSLVDNIVKAFRTDADKAYSFNSGETTDTDPVLQLAVGDGDTGGVRVTWPGRKYIYATFLAPKSENPSGNYRYAYAINWEKTKDVITGQLIVTYATTLKYRQSRATTISFYPELPKMTTVSGGESITSINGNSITTITENGITTTTTAKPSDTWFTTFISYVQALSSHGNQSTRQAIAAKLYKHVQQAQDSKVSKEDKEVACEILKSLQSQTKTYDDITRQLLNSALISLK